MHLLKLFYRVIARPLLRDPSRSALTLAAITLGVSVVIAIDLAGYAAAGSFRSSMETLTGTASLEIAAAGGVEEDTLGRLATLPLPLRFDPRVEEYVRDEKSGLAVPLIGIDLIAHAQRGMVLGEDASLQILDAPNAAWVGKDLGVEPGDSLRIVVQDRVETLHVAGVFAESDEAQGPNRSIVVDLPVAQRIARRGATIDRIEVIVPRTLAAQESAVREAIQAVLPEGVEIRDFGSNTAANRKMMGAFRWNLRILSGIALVVGAFLIYNTVSVSVVRRRAEIGVLRALGLTQARAQGLFLAEAAAFGLVGGALGGVLGLVLAEGAVDLLAATVNALYISSTPAPVSLGWGHFAVSLALGVGVSLFAALAPAREAGGIAPVEAMARGRREHDVKLAAGRNAMAGAALIAIGTAFCLLPPVDGRPLFGYLATLLLILGTALLVPGLVLLLNRATHRRIRSTLGVEAMLASRSLTGSLRRTSVLAGALATAVAMMASVGIMVGSFRETVLVWMDNQLKADLYLRAAAPGSPDSYPLMDAGIADDIEVLPEVAFVDRFRTVPFQINGLPASFGFGESRLMLTQGRMQFLPGQDRESILRKLPTGHFVIVSEPFSRKHSIEAGDALSLPLPGGALETTVLGVYNDYSSERGSVYGDRHVFGARFPKPFLTNVSITLKPGVSTEDGMRAVEQRLRGKQVLLTANRALREEAIRIFDQTFAITWALEGVAIFVAVMGMAGALVALVIDRRRELSLLRFLGASTGQVRALIYFEAGLLGLISNAVGLALGFALAFILIYVINRQSFGWTFQFHWPGWLLLGAMSLIYLATLASAWFPARTATRLNPIEVIHEE
ncbi:MAG: FtsX-like permease family protein [Bryobacterales bacterium]|nr:FtsX-like permease family protein [Bryobacterales bacterium]